MTNIPHNWLRRSGTLGEFERAQLERTAIACTLPLEKVVQKFGDRPFGEMTAEWLNFVQKLGPQDELWSFSSPDSTFAQKLGCQGYAILSDGVIRECLITLQT